MKRRTFLKSSTLLLPVITAFPAQAFSMGQAHQPRQFTQKEVDEAVKKIVTDHIRKGSKFTWDGDFVKSMGLDSLDTVEVIIDVEEVFNTYIPNGIAERIRTPRQLADTLFIGLNNAIVLYELPKFKGKTFYLFSNSSSGEDTFIISGGKNSEDMYNFTGSIYKPKGYELFFDDTVPGGNPLQKWEQKDLQKYLTEKGLVPSEVTVLYSMK